MAKTKTEPEPATTRQASPPVRQGKPSPESNAPRAEAHHAPRRMWIALVLLAIVAIAAGIAYWLYAEKKAEENKTRLELAGNIDVRQVNLAFKVEGRIAELAVDEGDTVEPGEVLATLELRYFEDDLRLARARRDAAAANFARLENGSRPEEISESKANVEQARAARSRARQDFDRAHSLVGSGAVSQEMYDQAKAALDEADARLKAAEEANRLVEIGPRAEDIAAAKAQLSAEDATVIQSEQRLADSRLVAPQSGTILTRAREKGAIVAPGETIFALTLTSPVWVRTYVDEPDLGKIHPGMSVEVHTDSSPKVYTGKIGFISPTAEFTPKTVETRALRTDLVYRLRVVVDNPDFGLRQGMPVTVVIDLDHHHNDVEHPE